MLGRRQISILSCVALIVGACTATSPEPSTAPSAASLTPASAPSVAASPEQTLAVASALPTDFTASAKPVKTPKAPRSAQPSQPSGPSAPNLIITKFVTDDDQFVVGVDSQVRITIKNEGTADAAPFDLGISFSDGVGGGGMTPTPIDGLAAGDSIQIPIVISPLAAGNLTYTATADARNVVSESSEDDNMGTLSVTVTEALPNLVLDSFVMTPDTLNAGGFDITFVVRNAGTADTNHFFEVGFTWAAATGGIGALTEVQCCYADPKLSPGATSQNGESPVFFPASGTYIVTAAVDTSSEVSESDETDNYATTSVNVP